MIIRGTTPTIGFSFKAIDGTEIAVAYLTVKQNRVVMIERDITTATATESNITWDLTQAETLSLKPKDKVKIQCRYKLNSGKVYRSRTFEDDVDDVDKGGEI